MCCTYIYTKNKKINLKNNNYHCIQVNRLCRFSVKYVGIF